MDRNKIEASVSADGEHPQTRTVNVQKLYCTSSYCES